MPLYLYQAAYTPESAAAQIREPADRFEAVRPAFEAMGGKIVVGGYPFGEYDMLAKGVLRIRCTWVPAGATPRCLPFRNRPG
jgi:uncharacterized protein with GYD domain